MNEKVPSLQSLKQYIAVPGRLFRRFHFILFIFLVAGAYAFVALRINTLSSAEPTEESITSQVNAAQTPHIDPAVINQLQSLQDNSVSVQALFDEARSNPFN